MIYLADVRKHRAARFALFTLVLVIIAADGIFFARVLHQGPPPKGSLIGELARGPTGWLMMASLGCWSLACLVLSFAIEAALESTSWVPLGLLLTRLQGIALALLAVCHPGLPSDVGTLSPILHQVGYFSAFLLAAGAALVLAPACRSDKEWLAIAPAAQAGSILLAALTAGLMLWPPGSGVWWEIAAIIAGFAWQLLCVTGVARSVRWFPLPWDRRRPG